MGAPSGEGHAPITPHPRFGDRWSDTGLKPGNGALEPAHPPALAILAFVAFVVGGVVFGGIFLSNWKVLMHKPEVTVDVPVAGKVAMGGLRALPVPVPKQEPAPVSAPKPALTSPLINLLPEWTGKDRITIALLGIDRRSEEPMEGTRSDTIMLVSIDPVQKSVAMVSLPRDLWVRIPGYGEQRINVAHAVGGPELTKQTITTDFGIPVQYYARVDFAGFEEVVNTIGGVIVDVDRPVKDDEYPAADYAYQRIYVPAGPQLMDGETALQYARSRHGENDFGRARRQQKVIVAMRERVLQLNMLPRAPQLLGIVQQSVSTDLSPDQILRLARLASEIEPDKITSLVIDTQYAQPFKGSDGADLLAPNTPAIRRAIDQALAAAGNPATRATVEVLNGGAPLGSGQQAADVLSAVGFDVVRIATADRSDYAQSKVLIQTGNKNAGSTVAARLGFPGAAVEEATSASPTADIRVILGRDYTPSTASR